MARMIGLVAGPLIFMILLMTLQLDALGPGASQVLALATWMVIWWITDAVPLPVTALLPLVLYPVFGIFTMEEAAAPYASPIVFLFMGGFLIALAMEKQNLHRRIALNILKITGTNANGIILGFMISTAFLSMWISNTATAVMMLPIALSIVKLLEEGGERDKANKKGYQRFRLGLMLSIAYAANIGGVATIVGTPPNVVFVGFMKEFYGQEVEFGRWLLIGIPVCVVMLLITYFMITRVLFPHRLGRLDGSGALVETRLRELGTMHLAEKLVAVVFFMTACCWVFKSQINGLLGGAYLNDTIIAMGGGILMFIMPVNLRAREYVLNWNYTEKLPWGILLLFGGGICLAKGLESTGIVEFVGNLIAGDGSMPLWLLILLLTAFTLYVTELMSNVALIVIFMPIVLGIAKTLEVNPMYLAVPVAIASSCAFMMPISTPPNAIVFSSGYIKMSDMVKAGFFLNLISVLFLVIVALTLVHWVYG
ncbi:solute carrier family 13 (sodium-dependent dicarboxylate transporter), member 2/3/5 [Sinomicrobium oceani]|uniref:Solute carrier family 13 (Sodium-dependent dicarboxylate transporter), member 2/3/5 n=1 Tax=Sinomicrobium oceani TaxID=1150368 RepID=A0A1K1LLX7_9FLAO|nr:DASS family sodium-coupled anion symporter [Sinomicrobium oceani]SFW11892.1 solute carrier family 13 (sodium-dependent dicarboxylate transporter), member 2/3/5 [Sinomicrobium oceani]